MGQPHQVDHVARVVGEGSQGDPARLARISFGAEHLAHIGRGAMQVGAREDLQHQRRAPADDPVGDRDGQEAHEKSSRDVRPVDHQTAHSIRFVRIAFVPAEELSAALHGLHGRISTLLVRL